MFEIGSLVAGVKSGKVEYRRMQELIVELPPDRALQYH